MGLDEALTEQIIKYSKDKTVLDAGGYHGNDAYTAIKAGAIGAVCVDDKSYRTYDNWGEFTPHPEVEYVDGDILNYHRQADVVIFKNVIYHQRNPWRMMEHLRTLTKEVLLLSTSIVGGNEQVWRIYRPFEGHPVSWTVAWRPTINGLIALLEATGFENVEIIEKEEGGWVVIKATPAKKLPIGFGERP